MLEGDGSEKVLTHSVAKLGKVKEGQPGEAGCWQMWHAISPWVYKFGMAIQTAGLLLQQEARGVLQRKASKMLRREMDEMARALQQWQGPP